ncbi:hypothetical protein E8E12_007674 [Didymella heteroderae]|uniref:Transcription factor n=1 Tax=Didymella heteroderae TaxID=1769908 RepID=A0A9P5C499_9PLEO|nr:hypothetical protein E8E12_007674 [Didymella heteroderae]
MPDPDQSIPIEAKYLIGTNETRPHISTFDLFHAPDTLGFQNDFDDLGWMTGSLDPYLWPISFDLGQEFDIVQNIGGVDTTSRQIPANVAAAVNLPTPASDIADLYSRARSPVLDRDAVEVRQYHATQIELDAPLHFPNIDPASIVDAELENFTHVQTLPIEKVEAITRLVEELQREPHHPPFTNLNIPPQPVLNAWVQLYFEYFHPVFPVLHKPTFLLPEVDPLLVLCVAGIGAQFSNIRNARGFAQSIHELVRRSSSSRCEKQNQLGRTVWMTQVIMLNNLAMSHSGDRRELEIAEVLQAVSIALARRKGMFEDVLPHDRIAKLQLPLEQAWRLWAVDEERRRTGFAIWLLDHSYRAHFNLTSIMDPCELRNSLPQSENRWSAVSAESWAHYPPGLDSGRTQTLGEVCLNATWTSVWPKTGTLGKQVILSELMEQARPWHPFQCHKSVTTSDRAPAREALESILDVMESQRETASLDDMKASLTHKVMCLAALMTCHAPATDLTVAALRQIYQRLGDRELAAVAQKWNECSMQGRMTVYYAARLFETIRNNHATHYAIPVYLLRAVLTLWLYARLFDNSSLTGFSVSRSVTITTNPNDVDVKLGLEYDLELVDLMQDEHHSSDHVQLRHPLAKIPAIEIEGYKLFESRAICRFLASRYPINPGFLSLPTDTDALGIFEQAASVEYACFEPAVSQLSLEKITEAVTGQDAVPHTVAHHEAELRSVLDYYESVLSKQKWLAGQNYSLIDVFHIPWFASLITKLGYQSEVESRDNVRAWWARAEQRPAWQKVLGGQ